ncbi:MAG TPA: hypothetical protein VLE02_02125 [Nitrosarchaeum sp.]|nr:hypothetical protein [Nitrosarchaeum sp.]
MTINDLFLECKKFAKNSYWEEIFENCSQNKFPKGVKYDSINHSMRVVFNSPKAKNKIIPLPKSPRKLYTLLVKIFSDVMDEEVDVEEKCVKKNKNKDVQIADFVTMIKKNKNLTSEQCKNLYHFLQSSLKMHFISKEDLVIKDENIIKIKNLKWDGCVPYISPVRKWSGNSESSSCNDSISLLDIFDRCVSEYSSLIMNDFD